MIALVNQGLFRPNQPIQELPDSSIQVNSGATSDTNWLDGQDDAIRELDQRTRQLEQEPEQW